MVMVTERTLVRRIAKAYENCTDQDKYEGAMWYINTNKTAQEIANANSIPLDAAIAVIAHMSPRVHWKRNVKGAELICAGIIPSGFLGDCIGRAIDALNSDNPIATINGNKTAAFAQNILGNWEAVTIDTWMLKAIGLDEKDLKPKGNYQKIESAFRTFGHRIGIPPAVVQAQIWCALRGRAN